MQWLLLQHSNNDYFPLDEKIELPIAKWGKYLAMISI